MNYSLIFQFSLLIFVFISKEFIVFNEEVLVLLSFFIFIFLVINYGKDSINESLNSKLEEIKNEFDFYKNLQKQTISYLINYHKKQVLLVNNVKKILEFSKLELKIVENYFNILGRNKTKLNFEDKLKKIVNCESQKNVFIQDFYLSNLNNFFITKYGTLLKFEIFNKSIRRNIILRSLDNFKNL
uniref:Uncharacterized protein ymf39 n=1 Tax=Rhodomonas salina TaxID=3034 RepID=Q9G8X1_RHDSA|nr:hypothetical protein RhsaoMp02 [Rhodomonas salina]AAG17726.1 unknown [Rhodomonas salina]